MDGNSKDKKLYVGIKVIYAGNKTEIISYIPSTGKYLLRGVPLPVAAEEVVVLSNKIDKDHKPDS